MTNPIVIDGATATDTVISYGLHGAGKDAFTVQYTAAACTMTITVAAGMATTLTMSAGAFSAGGALDLTAAANDTIGELVAVINADGDHTCTLSPSTMASCPSGLLLATTAVDIYTAPYLAGLEDTGPFVLDSIRVHNSDAGIKKYVFIDLLGNEVVSFYSPNVIGDYDWRPSEPIICNKGLIFDVSASQQAENDFIYVYRASQ
jgi:hypothetical protein